MGLTMGAVESMNYFYRYLQSPALPAVLCFKKPRPKESPPEMCTDPGWQKPFFGATQLFIPQRPIHHQKLSSLHAGFNICPGLGGE